MWNDGGTMNFFDLTLLLVLGTGVSMALYGLTSFVNCSIKGTCGE